MIHNTQPIRPVEVNRLTVFITCYRVFQSRKYQGSKIGTQLFAAQHSVL